jgi:hypothetical protein
MDQLIITFMQDLIRKYLMYAGKIKLVGFSWPDCCDRSIMFINKSKNHHFNRRNKWKQKELRTVSSLCLSS